MLYVRYHDPEADEPRYAVWSEEYENWRATGFDKEMLRATAAARYSGEPLGRGIERVDNFLANALDDEGNDLRPEDEKPPAAAVLALEMGVENADRIALFADVSRDDDVELDDLLYQNLI